MTTSQISRPTLRSPSRDGISWNVAGSGIATMSDSSIALKPVIDEPSKPMPSSSAPSSSAGVIAKLFRCPSTSVNQSRSDFTPSFSTRDTTSLRTFGLDVARCLLSTCAIDTSSKNTKAPGARKAPEAPSPPTTRRSLQEREGRLDGRQIRMEKGASY